MKLPSIQFYPGDWWKDPGVKMLTLEERGFWLQCLMLMHESEQRGKLAVNNMPIPEDGLALVMGVDNHKVNQILSKLLTYGVASREEGTGIIYSRRMVRDEEVRKIRQSAGKMGGNPRLLNQNPTTGLTKPEANDNQTPKQNPTPSSSVSVSSSDNTPKPPEGASVGKSNVPQSEEAKRIARLMGRRETTGWSDKEIKAYKKLLPIDPEDLAAVERYYNAERHSPTSYCRKDLCTLLNNWRGEVDRARAWIPQKPKNETPALRFV